MSVKIVNHSKHVFAAWISVGPPTATHQSGKESGSAQRVAVLLRRTRHVRAQGFTGN